MGNPSRFEGHVDQLVDKIYVLAVTLLGEGSAVESLVENVFAEGWDRDTERDMHRTEDKLVRELYRKVSSLRLAPLAAAAETAPDPASVLRTFPADSALSLLLVDLLQWPYTRVARVLEVDAATVLSSLREARQKLRAVLLHGRD